MLILTRRLNEQLRVGKNVTIKVVRIKGNQVSLAIEAPRVIAVHRQEVYERLAQAEKPGVVNA